MDLHGKKLGLLLSTSPEHPSFRRGLLLAETALQRGLKVYLYCIDEAVLGCGDARLQSLRARGLNLFACGYAMQRRGLPMTDVAAFAGLSVVGEIITATDRFVSFN